MIEQAHEWLNRMADAEDTTGCISVGGMAADLGQPLPTATDTIGGFPYADPNCKGCGKPLELANAWMTDGCPCNTPLGVNSTNETRWRLLMQLQQDQSREIARLRAENEQMRDLLVEASQAILNYKMVTGKFADRLDGSLAWHPSTEYHDLLNRIGAVTAAPGRQRQQIH